MSKKRPSLLNSLGKPSEHENEPIPPAEVVALTASTSAEIKKDVVKSTVYFPPKVHRKLKEIAFAKDCKVHDLVMEGISRMLVEHGHPSVDQLKEK